MKSQMFNLFLLIFGAVFFQPTHQYRLSKRELTEYDLTSFIVGTCSADKNDMLIQNLCDQTLQSALMGDFPFLTYYCKTLGVGMSYCNSLNQQIITNQNDGVKRFTYRRLVRNLNEGNKVHRKEQEMNIETNLEPVMIIEACITKPEKNSLTIDQFCNRTLQAIQQGQYPEIKYLCRYYPNSDYCQHVWFYSSSSSFWPLSKLSSDLPSLSSTDSVIPNINPSFVSSSIFKTSDIRSKINHQKQQLSSS
jgi:hypothetical protein